MIVDANQIFELKAMEKYLQESIWFLRNAHELFESSDTITLHQYKEALSEIELALQKFNYFLGYFHNFVNKFEGFKNACEGTENLNLPPLPLC